MIGSTVTAAAQNNQSYIVVPNTTYQLDYGIVQPYGYANITFNYSNSGQSFTVNANCQQDLLNGQVPKTPQQAQLLNAACQVAFGGFQSKGACHPMAGEKQFREEGRKGSSGMTPVESQQLEAGSPRLVRLKLLESLAVP